MELLFEYAMTAGAVLEANYPYEAVTGTCKDADTLHPVANISGYVQNGVNSYDDLMSSVANIGPVSVTVPSSAVAGSQLYFACEIYGHCSMGQKLTVTITGADTRYDNDSTR